MQLRSRSRIRRRNAAVAGALAFTLIAASCGGNSAGDTGGTTTKQAKDDKLTAAAGESGLDKAGEPVRGGNITFAIGAESNGGFCLSEAQLAIDGIQEVRQVYDFLTLPNQAGDYVPSLAKSVEPNADFTEWTLKIRDGIKFHDGSPLDAKVVKNNLDAYRGVYPGRPSLLIAFNLKNIDTVETTDAMTVKVTTKVPWPAFPAYLWGNGRQGIMGQAQLDDKTNCARNLIGTGPFKFVSWKPNESFKIEKNPDYWQIAPDGKPYPYLDSIEFQPITDNTVSSAALESGNIDVLQTANARNISTKWKDGRDAGKYNLTVSATGGDVAFVQMNETKPPFDDLRMRQALAYAADRKAINNLIGNGLPPIADGPLPENSIGYAKDTGFPQYDVAKAKELVQAYVADGGDPSFSLEATSDPAVQQTAQQAQQYAQAAGMKVKIVTRDQAALINDAIGKGYQAMLFRNFPAGDPDINYVWWYSGTKNPDGTFAPNPVNFGGWQDKEVDRLLDEGRVETDAAKRATIYQDLDKRMASQVHGVWTWFTPWAIVTQSNIHGVYGPPLTDDPTQAAPKTVSDDAQKPTDALSLGTSLMNMWKSK